MTTIALLTDRREALTAAMHLRAPAPASVVADHIAGLSLADVQEMTADEFAGHLDGLLFEGGAS